MEALLEQLEREQELPAEGYVTLLEHLEKDKEESLFKRAVKKTEVYYGNRIYIRGLIEFSSYCKNDCYYCGIRKSNKKAERYRLTKEDILACCDKGYALGFRTFVLQGGEDRRYDTAAFTSIISSVKEKYPDCAVTLSAGEQSGEFYRECYRAGADRYLLRHETADREHYSLLHPASMSLESRMRCLYELKETGYQTGCGMMVGSPGQSFYHLAEDLAFIKRFKPDMVGIGPFIPHQDTPFRDCEAGSVSRTLHLISIVRLLLPNILIPATTALGTLAPNGRELGILAGANVLMPNLSPPGVRDKYKLYDHKLCTGLESAENKENLRQQMAAIGREITTDRGDCKPVQK